MWVASRYKGGGIHKSPISILVAVWAASIWSIALYWGLVFQFSRPCGLRLYLLIRGDRDISILAVVLAASYGLHLQNKNNLISIRAARVGCVYYDLFRCMIPLLFQFSPPCGLRRMQIRTLFWLFWFQFSQPVWAASGRPALSRRMP